MKKTLVLLSAVLLATTMAFSAPLPDGSTYNGTASAIGDVMEDGPETDFRCIHDTLYYVGRRTMSQSYNVRTHQPYFCKRTLDGNRVTITIYYSATSL